MTVLIVDDHPRFRRLIAEVLGDLVDEVRECDDGARALALYAELRPDLVLMDVEMPGTDGITATRRIRAAFPDACVVVVTGHPDEPLREAARAAGARGYVLKENLSELRALVNALR